METKYFKKIYANGDIGKGVWKTGDGINYNDTDNYTVEIITKTQWDKIKNVKAVIVELDSKCTEYIYENIGDTHKQNKYLGRFCELQEKRLDGETLTTEEIAEKDALKELHRRYKAILAEYADMETRIENGETVEIVFNA
jgi:hypothetical protein